MNWLTKKIASFEAQAQTHEESVAWHLEAAQDAREWAIAYRGLNEAIERDDVEAARDFARMLGLELRMTRDGELEVVAPEEVPAEQHEAAAVAVLKRGS